MAKLYAELTSDKGGRVASKGGDGAIEITISSKNKTIGKLEVLEVNNTLRIWYTDSEHKEHYIENIQLT